MNAAHATFAVVAFLCGTATAAPPPVTVVSPCECRGAHGKSRWSVKDDVRWRQRQFRELRDMEILLDDLRRVAESLAI